VTQDSPQPWAIIHSQSPRFIALPQFFRPVFRDGDKFVLPFSQRQVDQIMPNLKKTYNNRRRFIILFWISDILLHFESLATQSGLGSKVGVKFRTSSLPVKRMEE